MWLKKPFHQGFYTKSRPNYLRVFTQVSKVKMTYANKCSEQASVCLSCDPKREATQAMTCKKEIDLRVFSLIPLRESTH